MESFDGIMFVWRVVILLFIILCGSYNIIYGVFGIGIWMVRGFFSIGVGMYLNNFCVIVDYVF